MLTDYASLAAVYVHRLRLTYHDPCSHPLGRGTVTLGILIHIPPVHLFVMANGKVDFFNDTGGYGFISTEDADEDVFFHMEDVGGADLEEGQEIDFDIEQAPKGPRATNVTRL